MKILCKEKGICLACKAQLANSFFARLKGLMGTKDMGLVEGRDGLLIERCASIHTFFMCYDLDVVFLTKSFRVVRVLRNIRPWRITRWYMNAYQVLEVKAGSIPLSLNEGDQLVVED